MKYGWIGVVALMVFFEAFVGSEVGHAFGNINANLFVQVQQALDSQHQ